MLESALDELLASFWWFPEKLIHCHEWETGHGLNFRPAMNQTFDRASQGISGSKVKLKARRFEQQSQGTGHRHFAGDKLNCLHISCWKNYE
jgi:hypothetical protein